jgi:hypothetical protein
MNKKYYHTNDKIYMISDIQVLIYSLDKVSIEEPKSTAKQRLQKKAKLKDKEIPFGEMWDMLKEKGYDPRHIQLAISF